MVNLDKEIERVLNLLRNKIREYGFTQLQVQAQLGWGRSYISQLLTRQKALRIEQILAILQVIGATPTEFFGELYGAPAGEYAGFQGDQLKAQGDGARDAGDARLNAELERTQALLDGFVRLIVDKGLLSREDVENARRGIRGSEESDAEKVADGV